MASVPAAESFKTNYCLDAMKNLNQIRLDRLLCDVTLVVEGQKFAAHRCVLAASSRYFYSLFTTDMKENKAEEIHLPELSLSVLDELLVYLYTGEVSMTEKNAEELVVCANYLLLPRLKSLACKMLVRSTTPTNCVYLHAFADKYECVELRNYARELMRQNFAKLSVGMSTNMLTLSVEHLEDLISSDEIVVNAEEEVFEAIIEWIREDKEARELYLARLFRHVRLGLISNHYFHTRLTVNPIIRSNSECMELVLQAIKWHVLHAGELPPQKPRRCLETHVDAVLTCGGLSLAGDARDLAMCYVPGDKTWYELASMTVKRCRHGFVACREFLYSIGGKGDEAFHQSVERFDPRTNSWTQIASMPTQVSSFKVLAFLDKP